MHGDKSLMVKGMVGAEEGSVKLSGNFLYVRSVIGGETNAQQTEYHFPVEGLEKSIAAGGEPVGNPGRVARYVLKTAVPHSTSESGLAVHLMDGDDAKSVMRKAVKKFSAGAPCMDGDKIASKLAAFIKGMAASKNLAKLIKANPSEWRTEAPTFSLRCDDGAAEGATVASVTWEPWTVLKVKDGKLVADCDITLCPR